MAGVTETREWTEQVYQLEQTDPVLGGPEGPSNLPHKHLANRTRWLREKILSATQSLTIHDDDGTPHEMVWIPRFRVPANFIADGLPPSDLRLGGFALDKYRASTTRYVGGAEKAVSRPFRQARVSVTLDEARAMARARVIAGRPAHVVNLRERATLVWLSLLVGHDWRGPTASEEAPRDLRDPDNWEYYGEPGNTHNIYGGTGPLSWAHQGLPSGVYDWLGFTRHMLDLDGYEHGVVRFVHRAMVAADIDEDDVSFEVYDPRGDHPPLTINMEVCHDSRRSAWGLKTPFAVEIFGLNMRDPFPQDD